MCDKKDVERCETCGKLKEEKGPRFLIAQSSNTIKQLDIVAEMIVQLRNETTDLTKKIIELTNRIKSLEDTTDDLLLKSIL